MNRRDRSWSLWILPGALAIAALLCGLAFAALWLFRPAAASLAPTAAVTVIPAPSSTATPEEAFSTPTASPPAASTGGIAVGMFVQISGTEGEGLRLRSGPGIGNSPRFLGMDAEVFEVRDGPKVADGYTWWYLVAPYDETRSGWAAANYLAVVPAETPLETPSSQP